MIDDLRKTVSATLYERVTSPLIGSFAVSWAIWNYKFFIIIASSGTYAQKKMYLDEIFPGVWTNIFNFCIMPLFGTGFYLFIYPKIAKYVYRVWQEYVADKEKIKQEIKKQIPITEEQANELRQSLASKTIEFENLLSDKSERIKELESRDDKNVVRLEEKDNKIVELEEALKSKASELKGYLDRNKVLTDLMIRPSPRGTLYSSKKGEHYCSSCFYSDPLKIVQVPREALPGQYALCPVCSSKYTHDFYNDTSTEYPQIPHKVDDDFLCWQAKSGNIKLCPLCTKFGRESDAILAKVSEDKYVCVLCAKEYQRVTSIAPGASSQDNTGS